MSPEQYERHLNRGRRYRTNNREKIREKERIRTQRPDRKAQRKIWVANNRQRLRDNTREWKAKLTPEQKVEMARRHRICKFKTKYGITPDQFEQMETAQKGVCAICSRQNQQVPGKAFRRLAVDHCHATKKIRGLLCTDCNTSIGKLGDTVEGLERALAYVRGNN